MSKNTSKLSWETMEAWLFRWHLNCVLRFRSAPRVFEGFPWSYASLPWQEFYFSLLNLNGNKVPRRRDLSNEAQNITNFHILHIFWLVFWRLSLVEQLLIMSRIFPYHQEVSKGRGLPNGNWNIRNIQGNWAL